MKRIVVCLMFLAVALQAKHPLKVEEIKVHSNIKEHPNLASLLGTYTSLHKKRVLYLYPSYGVDQDYLDSHIRASWLVQDRSNFPKEVVWGGTQPINNDHLLTPEEYQLYKAHGIVILKKDCRSDWNNKALYNALVRQNSKAAKKVGGEKYTPYMTLFSDNNKERMIYNCESTKWFKMCRDSIETSRLTTLHHGKIAILIDELGNIVHILDNVKSEKDIFNAFNIK